MDAPMIVPTTIATALVRVSAGDSWATRVILLGQELRDGYLFSRGVGLCGTLSPAASAVVGRAGRRGAGSPLVHSQHDRAGHRSRLGSVDRGRADGPPLPPELVESYFRYYIYTHSLVLLAAVVAILLVTRWRGYAWLAVPYALHIVMDIPTHERYQTRPFYPLSSWQYEGISWADPRIFWPNVIALIVAYAWILHSARRGRE
jgi:hypothetical protein